jgi:hypothetical protein
MVAAAIAIVAVVGLAYTFGMGRSFINRFEIARAALAAAQKQFETLSVTAPTDTTFAPGLHAQLFALDGATLGLETWKVEMVDDPADGLSPADLVPGDLKRVTLKIAWKQGTQADSIQLTRLFPLQ